jgi:hypothetical protein
MNRKTIGLILLGLSALAFIGSGVMKLVAPDEGMLKMGSNLTILAIIEFLIVAAIAIPKTRLAGIFLGASYWGAVIAFQWLVEGQGAVLPIIGIVLNTILFAGAALSYPSLMNGDRTATA